jgi:hypothetical protein
MQRATCYFHFDARNEGERKKESKSAACSDGKMCGFLWVLYDTCVISRLFLGESNAFDIFRSGDLAEVVRKLAGELHLSKETRQAIARFSIRAAHMLHHREGQKDNQSLSGEAAWPFHSYGKDGANLKMLSLQAAGQNESRF